jgi:hypothetical protein
MGKIPIILNIASIKKRINAKRRAIEKRKSPHNSFHRFPRAENLLEKSKYAHILIFYHKTIDLSYITLRSKEENMRKNPQIKNGDDFFSVHPIAPISPTFL